MQNPHDGERGFEIALEPGLEQVCQDVTEANARRLVACWNACEGISTESLESGQSMMAVFQKEQSRADRAEVGRDELMAALGGLLAYFESGNSVPVSQATIKASSAEVLAARAAIAKAGGEA